MRRLRAVFFLGLLVWAGLALPAQAGSVGDDVQRYALGSKPIVMFSGSIDLSRHDPLQEFVFSPPKGRTWQIEDVAIQTIGLQTTSDAIVRVACWFQDNGTGLQHPFASYRSITNSITPTPSETGDSPYWNNTWIPAALPGTIWCGVTVDGGYTGTLEPTGIMQVRGLEQPYP